MTIERLLASLEEYLTIKHELASGKLEEASEADTDVLSEAKKRFAKAFNEYIDFRTDAVIEDHEQEVKRRVSTERSVYLADILTNASTMPPPPDSDEEPSRKLTLVHPAVIALNCAPMPPRDVDELIKTGDIRHWLDAYKRWYKKERKRGLP